MDNNEMIENINSVILCMMAHPDNEPDSEFADRIDDLIDIKAKLKDHGVIGNVSERFIEGEFKQWLKINKWKKDEHAMWHSENGSIINSTEVMRSEYINRVLLNKL